MRIDEGVLGYNASKLILKKVNMNIDLETRIALVGPNGAGKSTLVKTLCGELSLLEGNQFLHPRLRVGIFTQHHMDKLDLRLSALEQMMEMYPNTLAEKIRGHLS